MAKKEKKPIIVKDKRGFEKRLLRPDEKAGKFAKEIKEKSHFTNFLVPKVNKNGELIPLTKVQQAFRAGYLQARADNAKVYNYKRKLKGQKK